MLVSVSCVCVSLLTRKSLFFPLHPSSLYSQDVTFKYVSRIHLLDDLRVV